jgi:transposase InsO family protein
MSSSVDRVEVFAGVQRRRRYTVDQKLAVLAEASAPGMTISCVARRHGISPSLIFGWSRRMTEGGKEAVRADSAIRLGFVPCFTPVRSPQSNGMAEAFVKTFKRDCVYVHDRPDAQTVLSQLPRWFEDYNESHPHKALRLKSPREFIRGYQPATCPVG